MDGQTAIIPCGAAIAAILFKCLFYKMKYELYIANIYIESTDNEIAQK